MSCIIHIVNSYKSTYCNDRRGLILELSRQALRVGGETFKVCRNNCATAKKLAWQSDTRMTPDESASPDIIKML